MFFPGAFLLCPGRIRWRASATATRRTSAASRDAQGSLRGLGIHISFYIFVYVCICTYMWYVHICVRERERERQREREREKERKRESSMMVRPGWLWEEFGATISVFGLPSTEKVLGSPALEVWNPLCATRGHQEATILGVLFSWRPFLTPGKKQPPGSAVLLSVFTELSQRAGCAIQNATDSEAQSFQAYNNICSFEPNQMTEDMAPQRSLSANTFRVSRWI